MFLVELKKFIVDFTLLKIQKKKNEPFLYPKLSSHCMTSKTVVKTFFILIEITAKHRTFQNYLISKDVSIMYPPSDYHNCM